MYASEDTIDGNDEILKEKVYYRFIVTEDGTLAFFVSLRAPSVDLFIQNTFEMNSEITALDQDWISSGHLVISEQNKANVVSELEFSFSD